MERNNDLDNLFLACHYLAAFLTEQHKITFGVDNVKSMDTNTLENKINETFKFFLDEHDVVFRIIEKNHFRFEYDLFKIK